MFVSRSSHMTIDQDSGTLLANITIALVYLFMILWIWIPSLMKNHSFFFFFVNVLMVFIIPHISGDSCCNVVINIYIYIYVFPSLLVDIWTNVNSKTSFHLEAPIQTLSLRNYFHDEETYFPNGETLDFPLIFPNQSLNSYLQVHPDSHVSKNPG